MSALKNGHRPSVKTAARDVARRESLRRVNESIERLREAERRWRRSRFGGGGVVRPGAYLAGE